MPVLLAPALDILITLVFAAVGRRNHGEGDALTGIFTVAWPFTLAAIVAWAGIYLLRRNFAMGMSLTGGVICWLVTVGLGMVLRHLEGRGIAVSFVIVSLIFNGVCMLGWRGVAAWLSRRTR